VIDDESGRTLAAASSRDEGIRETIKGVKKTEVAGKVGAQIAVKAKAAGVTKVAFDRGSYRYHGRVKALADSARAAGLEF
jgi:large subunit ribosomal protein L18